MKWHWFTITYLLIVIHDVHVLCQSSRKDCGTKLEISEKKNRKLKRQLRNAKSMLKDMKKERDTCIRELDTIGTVADDEINLSSDSTSSSLVVSVKCNDGYRRCMRDFQGTPISEQNAKIWCLRNVLWGASAEEDDKDDDVRILPMIYPPPDQATPQTRAMVVSNGIILAPGDMSQPPSGFRIRREYRMLSVRERQRFHDALNQLYDDGVIDTMARIHRRALRSGGAHGGPAFLPWHRAFLSFFEEALREVDSRVSLPYWDSSIDDNMNAGPGFSVMWDDDHLGQGSGRVNSGPFAGWVTANTPLRRRIARGVGSLIRQSRINNVMQFCTRSDFDRRWENAHNNVHRWIGGTMTRSLSASDPVFYMHHAFIDYQWEKFREHQSTSDDCIPNVNPASDYPPTDDVDHQPGTEMVGMEFLINEDGIQDFWTNNWYNYEDTPTCATNCGNNPDMLCDEEQGLCVGEVRFDFYGFKRKKRDTKLARESPRPIITNTLAMKNVCPNNPYHAMCPKASPPVSDDEYIEDMLVGNSQIPQDIEIIDEIMAHEADLEFEDAPDSGIPVFKVAKDEPSDCRSMETSALDLLTAVVKGKKISNRGYSAARYKNPNAKG